jgi:hypothetical protein
MQELLKSAMFKGVLFTLATLILLCGVFSLGVRVGERKAQHFSRWSENYGRMFGPRNGPGGGFPSSPSFGQISDAHGAFGKVLSINGSMIVIQGKDNLEQNIFVTTSTAIRIGRDSGTLADIHPDTDAAVFGVPNEQGQIEARLIRVMGQLKP